MLISGCFVEQLDLFGRGESRFLCAILHPPESFKGNMREDFSLIIAVSALNKEIEHRPDSWIWKDGDYVPGERSGEVLDRVKRWKGAGSLDGRAGCIQKRLEMIK